MAVRSDVCGLADVQGVSDADLGTTRPTSSPPNVNTSQTQDVFKQLADQVSKPAQKPFRLEDIIAVSASRGRLYLILSGMLTSAFVLLMFTFAVAFYKSHKYM